MTLDATLRALAADLRHEADTLDPIEPDDSDSWHADGYTDGLRDCADRLLLVLGKPGRPTAQELCALRSQVAIPGQTPASRRDAAHAYLAAVRSAGRRRELWSYAVKGWRGGRGVVDQIAVREALRAAKREGWR